MFKWLEKFLARPYEKAAEEAIIDKTEKPKDISEPVISFVECVKKNPKRFKVNEKFSTESFPSFHVFYAEITDKKTLEHFKTRKTVRNHGYSICTQYDTVGDFTCDEVQYVYEEVSKVYKERLERKKQILNLRAERKNKKERERLTKVYCNE